MRWSVLTALGLWLGLPGTGQAQSSLFPDMSIRRHRVPCELEDPQITVFRRQYYGYYPTCWRKFPPGWACPCPNPELPNWAAARLKPPLNLNPEEVGGPTDRTGVGGPAVPPGAGATEGPRVPPEIPELPKTREDVFDIPQQPEPMRELPDTNPGGEAPRTPPERPGQLPSLDRPGLAPPLERPDAGAGAAPPGDAADAGGPILAPPASSIPALDAEPVLGPTPGTVQAPEISPIPRRGFLSGLFAGRRRR